MFTAEIQFTISGSVDDAEDLIYSLLAPWRKHGQVLSHDWAFVKKGNKYRTFLIIFDADSLNAKYDDKYARKARRKLAAIAQDSPQIKILGEDPFSMETCTCKKSSFYILFTHFLSIESPIRCGDCFGVLPQYKFLSKQTSFHEDVNFWRETYKDCDSLEMGCTVGERFGNREISHFDSSLSKLGLSICNDITTETKIDTYYYLHRGNGQSRTSELKRKCPSCGGDWLWDEPLHIFDFKCDHCRLLSNIGFAVR